MTEATASDPTEVAPEVRLPLENETSPSLSGLALKTLATAGGLAAASTKAKAQIVNSDPFPCPIIRSGPPKELRLAIAASFGFTEGLWDDIIQQGYDAWLNQQLTPTTVPGWQVFEADLADPQGPYGYDILDLAPCSPGANTLICPNDFANRTRVKRLLVKARIIRALYSPAQLYERVVEFWTDHLNTWHLTPNLDRMKAFEDRSIREHALGNLSDLIYASATSPAMLRYLDGNANVNTNPNENYARELLELHTLGVDVCYEESTIETLARALTGWKVNLSSGPCCGEVTFNNNHHDNSAKVLNFGNCGNFFIPANSGQGELNLVIDILTDPDKLGRRTASFIAHKLATYFITCEPKKQLIDEMVQAYVNAQRSIQKDIPAMLSVLFSQKWIRCTELKMKRPLHLMTSALRALDGDVTDPGFVGDASAFTLVGDFLTPAGHVPFNWPAPDGYPAPCDYDYWSSNLLQRWSLGASLANDEFQFVNIDSVLAQMSSLSTSSAVVTFLNAKMFAGFWPFAEQQIVENYLDQQPAINDAAKRLAIGLAIGSPSFSQY